MSWWMLGRDAQATKSFFQVVNFIEAALWAAIGIGFAGYALLPRT